MVFFCHRFLSSSGYPDVWIIDIHFQTRLGASRGKEVIWLFDIKICHTTLLILLVWHALAVSKRNQVLQSSKWMTFHHDNVKTWIGRYGISEFKRVPGKEYLYRTIILSLWKNRLLQLGYTYRTIILRVVNTRTILALLPHLSTYIPTHKSAVNF